MSALHREGRFRHEALFYSGWADFVTSTLPFIRDGVDAKEPVLVVESQEKIEMLRVALDERAESVMFADMAVVGANPALIISAWQDFVERHGAPGKRLRGIGEPIWKGRGADELVECQRHESLLNAAFGNGQPWWLLCPYDTASLDPAVLDEARRSHEFVSEAGVTGTSPAFRGVAASGAPFDQPLPEPGAPVEQLSFERDGLMAVRMLVGRHATAAGLDSTRRTDLISAVNEIATNSIVHGGGGGTIRLWRDSRRITCEVRDSGRYDRPLADRVRPAGATAPSGLWVANQLCELVQIRTLAGGTVVRAHMSCGPRTKLEVIAGELGVRPPPSN